MLLRRYTVYIPSIARGIHHRNKKALSKRAGYRHVNLRGVAIGNGWIDVKIQGAATLGYGWWHGLIDLQTYRGLQAKWEDCMDRRETTDSAGGGGPFHPFTTPNECGVADAVVAASGGVFQYDVTTYDAYPAVISDGGTISNFFNDPAVRTALNFPSVDELPTWNACVPGSGRRRLLETRRQRELIVLDHDRPLSVVPYIAELLDDAHLDVLMYNGDLDLSCNSQGTEMALESMDWSGNQGWMDPGQTAWNHWIVDDQVAGRTKSFNNLHFVVVYNSGHFVPINQARNSLDMIGRLLDGQPFGDEALPMFPLVQESSREDQEPAKQMPGGGEATHARTISFALFNGLCGFLLGVMGSRMVALRRTHRKFESASSASSFNVTEATPLHHNA